MADLARFGQERRRSILDEVRLRGSVSVSDAADRLGVSVVTVRRDITAMARQGLLTRVHGGAVARRTAGRPVVASPAPMSAVRTVGVVTPSVDEFWSKVLSGAQAAASGYRGRLVLRTSSQGIDDDRRQAQRLVATGRIEGLLVAPGPQSEQSDELFAWLDTLEIPVVLMERTVPEPVFAGHLEWVSSDQLHSIELAVQHLTGLGHRRIELLLNEDAPRRARARDAWIRVCRNFGLDPDAVFCGDIPCLGGDDCDGRWDGVIARLLASDTTAVIVHSDAEAIALLQRCQELGVEVPGDVSLVSYDDEIAALPDPALTAIRPPKRQIGFEAASLVFRRLADPTMPLHRLMLTCELAVRATTGTPKRH
ncbi:MAG: LacI family transcriptional regulator [Propionibacteriaceae bacterium]|jgi:DNA-binding LacI/PurR family transcriptional regulator|nr:LacI family transcriptional regulator [Propionibacteriaceae bacterium]